MAKKLYKDFGILYKKLDGTWEKVPEYDSITGTGILEYYTLSSNPLELKVDYESEALQELYLSNNNVQWSVDNNEIVKMEELKHVYTEVGIKRVNVYIGQSDGTVISRGNAGGEQVDILIKVKNFLGTDIAVDPESQEDGDVETAVGDYGAFTKNVGTRINISAGDASMPLKIYTWHTWQLYKNRYNGYKVTLYADQAGTNYTIEGEQSNDSAPLVTSSYMNNKYAQFQKTWRFTTDEIGANPVDHIRTTTQRLYAKLNNEKTDFEFCDELSPDAEFVGTSGVDTVYYVDDSPAYVNDEGQPQLYRLGFELDTQDWPQKGDGVVFDSEKITQHSSYNPTPQIVQAPHSKLIIHVKKPIPHHVKFTSTGIDLPTFKIHPVKYANTKIPIVMSLADEEGNILKDTGVHRMRVYSVFTPWKNPDNPAQDTYYIGIETPTKYDPGDVHIEENLDIVDIPKYSTGAFILTSKVPLEQVKIVGAVWSPEHGLLTGMSNTFDILPSTAPYSFFKHGEEINYGETFNSYILQENINQHPVLENIFNTIFGKFEDVPSTLGKVMYEKIKNFVGNTVDVDTCNINALYGLAREVQVEMDNYNFSYPGSLKRVMDILSTGIKKMKGNRDVTVDDLTEFQQTKGGKVYYGKNVAKDPVNINTYMVTAGVPLVAHELYGDNRFKVVPSYVTGSASSEHYTTEQNLNALSAYPLSSYSPDWNWGLTYPEGQDFSNYYEFYEYILPSSFDDETYDQVDGLINWEETKNLQRWYDTLSESETDYNKWFNESGISETILGYTLRDGLKLIEK